MNFSSLFVLYCPEIARDYLHRLGKYQVVGGLVSPVNDGYRKKVCIGGYVIVSDLSRYKMVVNGMLSRFLQLQCTPIFGINFLEICCAYVIKSDLENNGVFRVPAISSANIERC